MSRKKQIITHGDFDGIGCAAMIAIDNGIVPDETNVIFTQPFLVDQIKIPDDVDEVIIADLAINNKNQQMTWDFIKKLEASNCHFRWYDHHIGWGVEADWDPHFTIKPDLPAMAVYFCDSTQMELRADAIAADTRKGQMSETGTLIEKAVRADMSKSCT